MENWQSVSYNADRGADIYKENEVIRIHISSSSSPIINTSESYLMFDLLLGSSDTSLSNVLRSNGGFIIPDPATGAGGIFSSMQIYNGSESTILEQLDATDVFMAMKNHYSNDRNDDKLSQIFEGRCFDNVEFSENPNAVPVSNGPTTIAGESYWQSQGGGFGSQYYKIKEDEANLSNGQRKVQVIYRFNQSGLLSAYRRQELANAKFGGIVLKLTLNQGAKIMTLQKVLVKNEGATVDESLGTTSIGYGSYEDDGVQFIELSGTAGAYIIDDTQKVYAVQTIAGGGPAQNWIELDSTTTRFYQCFDCNNSSITVGSKIRIGQLTTINGGATHALNRYKMPLLQDAGGNDLIVESVQYMDGTTDRVRLNLSGNVVVPPAGIPTNGLVIAVDIMNVKANYEVSNVQYIANTPKSIKNIEDLKKSLKEVGYSTYQNYRVNMTTGALQNELNPHIENTKCMSIFMVNQRLVSPAVWRQNLKPAIKGLRNYNWIYDGKLIPNLPVDLRRIGKIVNGQSDPRPEPLHQIELEKALDTSSIRLKSLLRPYDFFTIGRRLGIMGRHVDLKDKNLRLRLNFDTFPFNDELQHEPLLAHFFVHCVNIIKDEGGMQVVEF
jgi:hypothetical protein